MPYWLNTLYLKSIYAFVIISTHDYKVLKSESQLNAIAT